MSAKRDSEGIPKQQHGKMNPPKPPKPPQKPVVRNAFTPMFEQLRDELDEHHDRRERLIKVSRDVTALSKKIIFSLQRARKIDVDLPKDILSEVQTHLDTISKHLRTVAPDLQGINRHRYAYNMACLEELVEALTFMHYLRTQTLLGQKEVDEMLHRLLRPGRRLAGLHTDIYTVIRYAAWPSLPKEEDTGKTIKSEELPPIFSLTHLDYIHGVFDLTGEMMRFATTASALTGAMASADGPAVDGGATRSSARPRTIVQDMQDLGSFFAMLPRSRGNKWDQKMETLQESVKKVENLGYNRAVRGGERPADWVPDLKPADSYAVQVA